MPRNSIGQYSTTPGDNTDIGGINIAEGMLPSDVNNAMRELLSQLKEFQTGAGGDTISPPVLIATTATVGTLKATSTATFDSAVILSSDATLRGQSDLRFADSDSSNWVAFQAPATVSSNVTWTLPAADGTTGQLLSTNGSGTLSWASGGGGSLTGKTDSASPFETSLGSGAGAVNTGVNNTFVGFEAGNDNSTGTNNTAVGYQALDVNTTGVDNVALGKDALGANTTGGNNVGIGRESLLVNTTGVSNVAIGSGSLSTNTTGSNNVAIGRGALSLSTVSNNTAIGRSALEANTTGADNTAVGYQALDACTTGASNTAVGRDAGGSITTGNENTCLGRLAGQHGGNPVTTGGGNTYVGYAAGSSANNVNAEMVIFSGFSGTTGKGNNTAFINANGGTTFNGGNTTTWDTTSDQRLKKNIVDNTEGLEKITGIRVRNFEYRLPEEVDPELSPSNAIHKKGVQLGVIAQELAEVCPDCVIEQSTGVLTVQTDEIFWHMVNAIKELKTELDSLQAEINTLKGQ